MGWFGRRQESEKDLMKSEIIDEHSVENNDQVISSQLKRYQREHSLGKLNRNASNQEREEFELM